jgi:hypothetical protein
MDRYSHPRGSNLPMFLHWRLGWIRHLICRPKHWIALRRQLKAIRRLDEVEGLGGEPGQPVHPSKR